MKKNIVIAAIFLFIINTFSFFTFSSCKQKEISYIKSIALGELHSYYIFHEESSAIYFHSNRERKKIANYRPNYYSNYYRVYTNKQLNEDLIDIDNFFGDLEEYYSDDKIIRRKTGVAEIALVIELNHKVGDGGWELRKNPNDAPHSYCWDQNNNDYYFIYSNKYNAYTFYVGEDKLVEKALLSLKKKKDHYLISYYTVNIYENSYTIQKLTAEVPKSDILLIEYAK